MTRRRRRGHGPRDAALTPARALTAVLASMALAVGAAPVALAAPAAARTADPSSPDPVETGLADLRDDAEGDLHIARDEVSGVVAVASTDGGAVLETSARTPAGAARELLREHGTALGLGQEDTGAVVTRTLSSATGGTVVRAEQQVGGLPVLGGQVVTVLDAADDVVSVEAATTQADEAPGPRVAAARAQRTAVAATADVRGVAAAALTATVRGRVLYDPVLLGEDDPLGARPVWEVEVGDGGLVRETVLVGTDRGEVALRLDEVRRAGRWVCDHAQARTSSQSVRAPVCATPKRVEGAGPSALADVDAAYDHVGETLQTYADLGVDLEGLVATPAGGTDRVVATVRWCVSEKEVTCPWPNAAWDGRQVLLGTGFAAADDVVAHELTHGYVDHTAGLLYHQQSGALDESFADVLGEVVDQRHGEDDDSAWVLGEDVPGRAGAAVRRSLADPTLQRMPDRMTSADWVDEHAVSGADHGGVHTNAGVGNKTAHLISQGGDFNNQRVTGLDVGDPTLRKTALLYLEVIPTLTSGAGYAELGRALEATCVRLADTGTGGFTAADCATVRQATTATELPRTPVVGVQPTRVDASCPDGTSSLLAARDDDAALVGTTPGFGFALAGTDAQGAVLASRPGPGDDLEYAVSGRESLFLYNPDPALGDARVVTATSRALALPRAAGGTFLHFHHAYAFQQADPTTFNDGATVRVERRTSTGAWQVVDPLVWTDGPPEQEVRGAGTRFTGFGGDSRGWGSSRLDLTSLAGQTVRVQLRVEGDASEAAYGWWLDDLRLYSCVGAPPGEPTDVRAQVSGSSVTVSWQPPATGTPQGYQVLLGDRQVQEVTADRRSATLTGLPAGAAVVGVRVLAVDGQTGPAATRTVQVPVVRRATTSTVTPSVTSVRANRTFTVKGTTVLGGTRTGVAGVRTTLQRRVSGSTRWVTVSSRTTSTAGTAVWSVRQTRTTAYRVVASVGPATLASTSPARTVRRR